MPKTAMTHADRIAAIKAEDAATRADRAELDAVTLDEMIAAATEALPALERLEAACGNLVSDLSNQALKTQGSHMSDRVRNILVVAQADLSTITAKQEA